jgi:hypothetical protein
MAEAPYNDPDAETTVTVTGVVETQWRVVWFPPEGDAFMSGPEAKVRAKARREREWNPIVESRTVVVADWETVENLRGRGRRRGGPRRPGADAMTSCGICEVGYCTCPTAIEAPAAPPGPDPAPWRHVDGARVADPTAPDAPQGGYTFLPREDYSDHPERYVSTRWPNHDRDETRDA